MPVRPRHSCRAVLQVQVDNGVTPNENNRNNGQYEYTYVLTKVGAYTITVTQAAAPQQPLKYSPGQVRVTIGAADLLPPGAHRLTGPRGPSIRG